MQRLPARQTAALVLCDVLGFATAEAAAVLDTTPSAVKGVLQRARATLQRDPVPTTTGRRATGAGVNVDEERELARRFADAFAADDIDRLVSLLTDDAWLTMPPAPHQYHGTAAVTAFLHASAQGRGARRHRLVPTRANTQPAFACYLTEPEGTVERPTGIVVLTTNSGRISAITRFLDPRLPRLFGLTDTPELVSQ